MRKENFCYDQNNNERENIPNWKTKICENFDQKKKNTRFYKNIGNNYQGYQGNNYKHFNPLNPIAKEREPPTGYNKNTTQRERLKCWECGEPHYIKYFPIRNKKCNSVHSIKEATTMGDMARSKTRINASLENQKEAHQTSIIEIEGMIKDKPISILIDPGASLSYSSPRIVELYKFQ